MSRSSHAGRERTFFAPGKWGSPRFCGPRKKVLYGGGAGAEICTPTSRARFDLFETGLPTTSESEISTGGHADLGDIARAPSKRLPLPSPRAASNEVQNGSMSPRAAASSRGTSMAIPFLACVIEQDARATQVTVRPRTAGDRSSGLRRLWVPHGTYVEAGSALGDEHGRLLFSGHHRCPRYGHEDS